MTHWTEAAIAAALEGRFFLTDGRDKNAIDAKLEAELLADKLRVKQEIANRRLVEAKIAAQPGMTAGNIIAAVAFAHRIGVADLTGGRRSRHIAHARQHACALMRELAGLPFQAIAAAVGIVDHSTAHHNVKTWAQRGHVYAIEDKRAREMLGVGR